MKPTTATEMIEGLKKGVRYRTEHGEFTLHGDQIKYRDILWLDCTIDIVLSEIGDRLIVEEPRPKVWLDSHGWVWVHGTDIKAIKLSCTPDMVPLIEKAVRELGGLQ